MPSKSDRPGMFAPGGTEPRGFRDSRNLQQYNAMQEASRHQYGRGKTCKAEVELTTLQAMSAQQPQSLSSDSTLERQDWEILNRSLSSSPESSTEPRGGIDTVSAEILQQNYFQRSPCSSVQETPQEYHSPPPQAPVNDLLPVHSQSLADKSLPPLPKDGQSTKILVLESSAHLEVQRQVLLQAYSPLRTQAPLQVQRKPLPFESQLAAANHVSMSTQGDSNAKTINRTSLSGGFYPSGSDPSLRHAAVEHLPILPLGTHQQNQSKPADRCSQQALVRPSGPPRHATLDTGDTFHELVGITPSASTSAKNQAVARLRASRPDPPPRIPTMDIGSGESLHATMSSFLTADFNGVKDLAQDMPAATAVVKGGVKSFLGSQKR